MAHLVLDQDHTLTGVHHGSIRVLKGSFVMVGTLYGTLELLATATALVVGWQKGGVVVAGGALVVVTGNLDGDVSPPVPVGTRITGITDARTPAGGAARGSPPPPNARGRASVMSAA